MNAKQLQRNGQPYSRKQRKSSRRLMAMRGGFQSPKSNHIDLRDTGSASIGLLAGFLGMFRRKRG